MFPLSKLGCAGDETGGREGKGGKGKKAGTLVKGRKHRRRVVG